MGVIGITTEKSQPNHMLYKIVNHTVQVPQEYHPTSDTSKYNTRSSNNSRRCTKYQPRLHAYPANMLTLGQRRQALALERQRRRRGDDVGPTLFRRRLATSHDDANPTSGDDVGSTLFRRRLATSQYDGKPTSGDDVGSTLFRRRLATSQYDAKPTSGDDVGSTLFPRR